MSPPVDLSLCADVATLTIEGAIDQSWADAFAASTRALQGHGSVRVVVVRSEGRWFCPGGDLSFLARASEMQARRLATTFHEGLLALRAVDAPSIAEVHASAAGAGLSLVLACDFAIAARSASFTTAYSKVGLSTDGGVSWLLPRRVGWSKAMELLITSRRISADEAVGLGAITEAVEDAELGAAVARLTSRLSEGPTPAYGAIRRLLDLSATATLHEQLDAEAATIARSVVSPVGRAGISAFLEKRSADFRAL